MADRDTVQLIIDILGQDGLEKLALAAEKVRERTEAAAKSYEVLDTVVARSVGTVGTYEIATDRINHELDDLVAKSVEATRAQQAMAQVLDASAGKTSGFGAALSKMQGGLIGASYGLQDVVTVLSMGGGLDRALMSATNNITPMLIGLGMGGGLAGVAGLAVTAIASLSPALDKLGVSFDNGVKTKVPEATDRIDRLTDSIKKDRESIEELRKARELDFFQLQEYIKKTAELNNAEQALADARKARSVGPGQDRASRERGSAFREALQEYGGGEKLIGALERAGMDTQRAERAVSDALAGAPNAINDIRGRLAGTRDQIGYRSPEQRERDKRNSEVTEANLKRNAEAVRQQERDKREQSRELNRQLQEIARDQEREQKADERARGQQVQRDVRLGRRVGEAATRRRATPVGDMAPLLPITMDSTPAQVQMAIARNQQAMTANMAALQQAQEQARAVMQQQRQLSGRIRRGSEQSPLPSGLQR
jgi:hypothetical protein